MLLKNINYGDAMKGLTVLIIILAVFTSCLHQSDIRIANYNNSSFLIEIDKSLIEPDIVFYDIIQDSRYDGIFKDSIHFKNDTLYDVIAVAVITCLRKHVPISKVIKHELTHYRQMKEYDSYEQYNESYNIQKDTTGYKKMPFELEAVKASEKYKLSMSIVGIKPYTPKGSVYIIK